MQRYFKNGCLSRKDIFLSIFSRSIPYNLNAAKIIQLVEENLQPEKTDATISRISIPKYNGTNFFCNEMAIFINEHLSNDILGAYVHGSVGNHEEIVYSDFDGLVIIKKEVFNDKKRLADVARQLKKSETIMFKMDPLQHHGWFVITEQDLIDYPEHYFPHVLFSHAQCIYGITDFPVSIQTKEFPVLFKREFENFCNHLLNNIRSRNFEGSYYDLKSMLSGFMLLPSIFLQAYHGRAIFKKQSFTALQAYIDAENFSVMNEISAIRAHWNYSAPAMYRLLLNVNNPFLNKYFKKRLSGKPSIKLLEQLNTATLERMLELIEILQNKIKNEVSGN